MNFAPYNSHSNGLFHSNNIVKLNDILTISKEEKIKQQEEIQTLTKSMEEAQTRILEQESIGKNALTDVAKLSEEIIKIKSNN